MHVISFIFDFELPFLVPAYLSKYDILVLVLFVYLHKLTMKTSSWQPLCSLLVNSSGSTFGSKSWGRWKAVS